MNQTGTTKGMPTRYGHLRTGTEGKVRCMLDLQAHKLMKDIFDIQVAFLRCCLVHLTLPFRVTKCVVLCCAESDLTTHLSLDVQYNGAERE